MTIRFLSVAQTELDEAVNWYVGQAPLAGDSFLSDVIKSLMMVERHPLAWPQITPRIRRHRMSRFPYGIIYLIEDGEILVVAIAHLHRKPLYWKERLKARD